MWQDSMEREDGGHRLVVETGDGARIELTCRTGETLLAGLRRNGCRTVPVGCRSGGCGVCRVRVMAGAVTVARPMSATHVSAAAHKQGQVLACCVVPDADRFD